MGKATISYVFFTFLSICVYSQKNLRSGYIVLNSNDTIKGFIDYKEWNRNPSRIAFTTSKAEKLKSYSKTDISYFEITNQESYRKYLISATLDPSRINDISEKSEATTTDEVFLKLLYEGQTVKLFSYEDEIKLRFYILVKGNPNPVELKNSMYITSGKFVSDKEYRMQLIGIASTLLPGNTELLNSINRAAYSEKDILAICYKLDGISEADQIPKSHENQVRLFAGFGINKETSSFSGDVRYVGIKGSNTSPLFSFGIDILANPQVRKFYLHNSFTYSSYKTSAKLHKEYYEATEDYVYELKQNNLVFNCQPVLNWYNRSGLQIFTGVGAIGNFAFNKTNNQTVYRRNMNGSMDTYYYEDYLFLKKFWLNFSVRAGVTIKDMSIAFNYLPRTTISTAKSYSLQASNMQIELLYLFQKKRPQD
jgi:hypothetical protein